MASDWAISNRKKKNSKTVTSKQITSYPYEFIYKYKNINQQEQITYDLSSLFDKINEMFKTSTQYLESKKKINYNQYNHNKWEKRKDYENNVINNVYSAFNRVSNLNKQEILRELKELEIIVYTDLEKLIEKIINKCIIENQYIELYIEIIKFIITDCKWIVQDNNLIPITFRKIFLNQLETRFDNMLNDIINMKYNENETELIEIHRQNKKGLILMIGTLYKYKIIGNQLIRLIFTSLEISYEDTKENQYLEYWILLFNIIIEYWIKDEHVYLNEKINYIKNIQENLPFRINFLLQECFTKNNINNIQLDLSNNINIDINSNENKIEHNDIDEIEQNDIDYETLILSITEYNNITEWFNEIKTEIKNKDNFIIDVITCTINNKKMLENIKEIIKYLNYIEYIDSQILREKIEYIKETYDLIDTPYYKLHLIEFENI
jgi:hypothetical protein